MTSLTKKHNQKNIFSLQMPRLAKSFEGLNSSLAQSSVETFPSKNTCKCWILALAHQKPRC